MFIYNEGSEDTGYWAIVDCQPEDIACGGGAHKFLRSAPALYGEKCPWNANGPWNFCSGELIIGGVCSEYTVDTTVKLTCV